MPPAIPEHRVAICRRCRQPERIASGADSAQQLLDAGRAAPSACPVHVRLSQCLNCCDGGHTVRVECNGLEVAVVGIRTTAELERFIAAVPALGVLQVPADWQGRVYQVWRDGRMTFHRGHGHPFDAVARDSGAGD